MLSLSEPPGPFSVGATTFLTLVPSSHSIGSIKLRNQQPALSLDEVAFTAYYPADVSKTSTKGLHWLTRPLKESLGGFSKFSGFPRWVLWPIVYLFGSLITESIKIPVYPGAPLRHPKELPRNGMKDGRDIEQWPLVIFSHGLGGSRTAYSMFCSRLAASGKVVLAMEHRDGTGYACLTSGGRSILYYKDDDVILKSDTLNPTPLPLRTDQLQFRREEIYTVYHNFRRFLQRDFSVEMKIIDSRQGNQESWHKLHSVSGKSPICFDKNVILAGHSFGGCTVLSILTTNPPSEYTRIPLTHALVLDPWLEPLPESIQIPTAQIAPASFSPLSAAPTSACNDLSTTTDGVGQNGPHDNEKHLPRALVINSERFTLWKDHFARLQDVIRTWEPRGRRILTLVGSKHESFSDFPNLPLVRTTSSKIIMNTFLELSIGFLDDNIDQALDAVSVIDMETRIVGKGKYGQPKRKLIGNVGDIIVC